MENKHTKMLKETMHYARFCAGLTQKELAKKMDTKQPNIARWETRGTASIETAERFIRACGYQLKFHHVSILNKRGGYTLFFG